MGARTVFVGIVDAAKVAVGEDDMRVPLMMLMKPAMRHDGGTVSSFERIYTRLDVYEYLRTH